MLRRRCQAADQQTTWGGHVETLLFIADIVGMVYLVYWSVGKEKARKAPASQNPKPVDHA